MDLKISIYNIQEKLLNNFEMTRTYINDQMPKMGVEDTNSPSHKHLQFLLKNLSVLVENIKMSEFRDRYRLNPTNVNLLFLLGQKVETIKERVQIFKAKYKEMHTAMVHLKDCSFLFSIVLLYQIWHKCWMFFCMRYDIIMRCIYKVSESPAKYKAKELFTICISDEDVELLVAREGLDVLVQQNVDVDNLSYELITGQNNLSHQNKEKTRNAVADYLATSTLLDNLVNSDTKPRSRMPYTKNFTQPSPTPPSNNFNDKNNPSTMTMSEYCTIKKRLLYVVHQEYYSGAASQSLPAASVNSELVPRMKVQQSMIKIEETVTKNNVDAGGVDKKVMQPVAASFSFDLGLQSSFSGYEQAADSVSRLRELPVFGPLLDVNNLGQFQTPAPDEVDINNLNYAQFLGEFYKSK
ncbi:unnamed protein product [Brassicogethes aeneus]|uniref:Uncharacterized protein n=1 Tax=Brassicogethes aeneus TaxID=1431903 RepID=A0A9P0BAC7_BRAAE|nr:unnamed protein product [Brassicogethes aeneus]